MNTIWKDCVNVAKSEGGPGLKTNKTMCDIVNPKLDKTELND